MNSMEITVVIQGCLVFNHLYSSLFWTFHILCVYHRIMLVLIYLLNLLNVWLRKLLLFLETKKPKTLNFWIILGFLKNLKT